MPPRLKLGREIVITADDLVFEADDWQVDALHAAMDEFEGIQRATYNSALHLHYPKGHPLAGQFMPMVDRLVDALKQHAKTGKGDPFDGFDREQLRKVAVKRGIKLQRGASRDDISKALIADLTPGGTKAPTPTPTVAAVAAPTVPTITTTSAPTVFGNTTQALDVAVNGVKVGHMEQMPNGRWYAHPPTNSGYSLPAASNGRTRAAAIKALADAHLAQGAPTPTATPPPSAPNVTTRNLLHGTVAVAINGSDIGAVVQSSTGSWNAHPGSASGLPNPLPGGPWSRRKDAVDALVAATTSPAPSPPSVATPTPSPVGARRVPLSVAGIPNVTTTPAPVPVRHLPSSTMHGAKQSQDIHIGGVHIGTVHQYNSSIGWLAETPAGNPPLGLNGRTKADAIKALVAAHNSRVASPPVPAPAPTAAPQAPKITTRKLPSGSYAVLVGGVDLGTVGEDFGGKWIAEPATAIPGARVSGGHATRKHAIDALYNAHLAAQASAPPPQAPAVPSVPSTDPVVKAAQDVLYGVDPKGKTAARQLAVYGALKRAHFDTLDATEQSTLLGDLSYIATTAKGPNAAKAQKLIDRLTPPGTPLGTIPTPSAQFVGPANGTQTRLPAPQPGLLRQAKNSGVRGDDWLYSPTGGPKVWGTYGSGGLLLRHVDAQGVERFLMTQRGPAISDPGKWSYPGGAFESLEDFHQGATREVAEELGWTDADFAAAMTHGHHVSERPDIAAKDGKTGAPKAWTYHSIAATVPTQIQPNLKTHHARAETSDAKWMTRAEIDDLDRQGKLHAPVAGGKLQQNVMSLFPPASAPKPGRPGAQTTRPPRLPGTPAAPPAPKVAHKQSRGVDLLPDKATKDKLRQDVKRDRKKFAGKVADDRLAAIGAMQGFDDTPTVVTKAEMDRLLATGDYIEAWRGVKGAGYYGFSGGARGGGRVSGHKTAAQISEDMRSGVAYYGTGIFGNGYYFSEQKSIAQRDYADGTKNSLIRALIPKSASVIDHGAARKGAESAAAPYSKAKGSTEDGTLYDEGRYAAARGYAGVRIPYTSRSRNAGAAGHIANSSQPAWLWLDRSTLIVQEAE